MSPVAAEAGPSWSAEVFMGLRRGYVVVSVMLVIIGVLLLNIWRRVRMENALRESEQRWKALYQNLPGYTFVVGPDYRIRDVNEALCDLTGYARDELIGEGCDRICCMGISSCPAHAEEDEEFSDSLLAPLPCASDSLQAARNAEGTVRTKDGRLVPILRSIQRMPFDGEDIIIQNFQDLSARKEAEDVLRRSGEAERTFRESLWALFEIEVELMQQETLDTLCRRAVELARDRLGFERLSIWLTREYGESLDGAFGIDESGGVCDLRGRQWTPEADSPTHQLLTGRGPRSLCRTSELFDARGRSLGQAPWAGASMWGSKDLIGVVMTDTYRTGRPIGQIEQNILTLLATSLGFLCQRLLSEAERARLAQAVEQAAEGILITDTDGHILYVNEGLTRMFGQATDALRNLPVLELFSPDCETGELAALHEAMRKGEVFSSPLAARTAEGKPLQVETTLSPIRDNDQKLTHFALILRDISKEAQLEQQLRQSAKMEAVGRLAGGIAHDFNNQLTVIRGYTDLLMSEPDLPAEFRSGIEQIDHASQQATALTSQLLSFSRKQVLEPQVIAPSPLLQTMVKSLRLVGEDIQLDLDLQPETGHVCVDPNRLEQAIMNLVINARDAMPEGGRVRIATANVTIPPAQAALTPLGEPGPHVLISVADTGTGMDAETLEMIFEPFFTTKEKGKGTGLGLAMVYGFIQQSQGHIEVDSQPGRGTTFQLYLPLAEAPVEEDAHEPLPETLRQGQSTVLIVEDDDSVRLLIDRVLREKGYRTLSASRPAEVEELIAAQPDDEPELLVSDVVMPGCSGPNLLARLRQSRPRLKCLLVSGYSEEAIPREGLGPVTFLHKPFTPDRLLRAVAEALQQEVNPAQTPGEGLFESDAHYARP